MNEGVWRDAQFMDAREKGGEGREEEEKAKEKRYEEYEEKRREAHQGAEERGGERSGVEDQRALPRPALRSPSLPRRRSNPFPRPDTPGTGGSSRVRKQTRRKHARADNERLPATVCVRGTITQLLTGRDQVVAGSYAPCTPLACVLLVTHSLSLSRLTQKITRVPLLPVYVSCVLREALVSSRLFLPEFFLRFLPSMHPSVLLGSAGLDVYF